MIPSPLTSTLEFRDRNTLLSHLQMSAIAAGAFSKCRRRIFLNEGGNFISLELQCLS